MVTENYLSIYLNFQRLLNLQRDRNIKNIEYNLGIQFSLYKR